MIHSLPVGGRVFINAMNGLGDFLLTMPTIRQLKLERDARITVLGWYYLEEIARAMPFIDRFLAWNEEYRSEEGFARLCAEVAASGPYDVSIDLAFPPRSALISEATGAPVKLQVMSSETLRPGIERVERLQHHGIMTETWRILDRLGVARPEAPPPLQLVHRGEDYMTAREILQAFTPGARRILIHPGAGIPARRWDPARLAELADRLASRYFAEVMFLGGRTDQMSILAKQRGEKEEDEVGEILARCRGNHRSAAGRDNTRVLALLLEQCDLFIGNNSGPAHLSGQLGARTLVLWGASDPREWSPVGPEVEVAKNVEGLECYPCSPSGCDDPVCMRRLSVEDVLDAIERRWPGLPPRSRPGHRLLELASGARPQVGHIHLDYRAVGAVPGATAEVDILGDVTRVPTRRAIFRQIHAQHIIEHFPRGELSRIVRGWVEALEPGGAITVVTPNLAYIARGFLDGTMPFGEATGRLYGDQDHPGNFHYHLFDRTALLACLREAGCDPVYDVTARHERREVPMSLYAVGFRSR